MTDRTILSFTKAREIFHLRQDELRRLIANGDAETIHVKGQLLIVQESLEKYFADKPRATPRPGDRPPSTYYQEANKRLDPIAPAADEIPAMPASSPWACDPAGKEPPLGEDISRVPDVSKVGG